MRNATAKKIAVLPVETIIRVIRGSKVVLDSDLANLYGVKAIALRQQVTRNRNRFPDDFMFRLTEVEVDDLVSQSVIPSKSHLGGYLPYVFTQEGIAARVEKQEQNRDRTTSVIEVLMEDIDQLSRDIHWIKNPPLQPKRRIGFHMGREDDES